MSDRRLSFVIPTLNEAEHIEPVIRGIRERLDGDYDVEIVVVDNASTDATVSLAQRAGARTLVAAGRTVAAQRNRGARETDGEVLIFLDGDVYLTDRWVERLPQALERLRDNSLIVTGSRCGIGSPPSWIERWWFEPLLAERANYINSGHLITTRRLFDRVAGFREELETGEDYDFSMRARAAGALIENDPQLAVIHAGYPGTLGAFIRRESWHGRGNFVSLGGSLASPVALLSIAFLALHALFGIALGLGAMLPAAALAFSIAVVCLCASAAKYGLRPPRVLVNAFLYYFYFWGRSWSLITKLFRGAPRPADVRPGGADR